MNMNIKAIAFTLPSLLFATVTHAQVTSNESCVINILNRGIQVGEKELEYVLGI